MLLEQKEPVRVYLYPEIAEKTGIDLETVKRLGYSIDAGSNGFTALRGQLTLDEAMAEMYKCEPAA